MLAKIINLTPHDINIVGVTDMDRNNNAMHHLFPDNAESNTPCVRCGTWKDEACDVICTLTIPKSGEIARVEETVEVINNINGIPIVHKTFGEVIGLPEPQDNNVFIVSLLVAQAVTGEERLDVLVIGDSVRNGKGQIIGAKSLAFL